jgi:valyl-tRNA synthetase
VSDSLPKVYDPKQVEAKWYQYWQEKGYFHANNKSQKKPYTVVIPPPNVTGILTMGHVLNNTIQDILVRYARMRGFETLWLPGTDHAGIATQNVVEKHIKKQGRTRFDYGRETFTQLVWDWANKHKGIILQQLKKIGCSLDWERERFTLDEGLSLAVRKVFVDLYHKGLIYRGRRIINWCPVSQTALSDEEVIHKETAGHLWYFRYPLADGQGFITVATTRPETMLGDTAVAVNPKDERYRQYIGKLVKLPLVERIIPIIADDFVDREFGTGAVKVTPAHDPNDFEIAQRHNLPCINIMNPDATLNDQAGALVAGKERFEARKIVVAEMERLGLLEKVEKHVHNVGYSERAGVMIEPYLSEQWFVRMKPLAEPALQVVLEKQIRFHPERWVKVYRHWMENVRDWCISRQLWWGHRIPVFYCDSCHWQDALLEDPSSCPQCGGKVRQDEDVLDTWFSSWLWPFSTMGWPEETDDLKLFYPTDDLVTAPDIIFFWVARMIMAGLEFRQTIPFKNVFFTGIIRDIQGRKMSKSLGNSPDPLVLVDKYGADALRFGIMLIAPQGQDILFSEERLEVGRNFMNKIWNAARFLLLNPNNAALRNQPFQAKKLPLQLADQWILFRLNETIRRVDRNLHRYRFDEVARIIYDFVWSDFCDWYIEVIKERLYQQTGTQKEVALQVALHVLKSFLKLLHPYAPFITEEIYQKIKADEDPDIIVSKWPRADFHLTDEQIPEQFALFQEIVTLLRTARSEFNLPPGKTLDVIIRTQPDAPLALLLQVPEMVTHLRSLVKINDLQIGIAVAKPSQATTIVIPGAEIFIPLAGLIDIQAELQRLNKEIERLTSLLKGVSSKLSNPQFLAKAPQEVVAHEREKERSLKEQIAKLQANLQRLAD